MLIQAQCQSEREKCCKITADDQEIKNADGSTTVTVPSISMQSAYNLHAIVGATDVEMLDLDSQMAQTEQRPTDGASGAVTATAQSKTATWTGDNGENGTAKEIKIEATGDDDPYSKDIAIEPRTYCKLGHFHLLLEDYPKGMYPATVVASTRVQLIIIPGALWFVQLQPYPHTRNSIV